MAFLPLLEFWVVVELMRNTIDDILVYLNIFSSIYLGREKLPMIDEYQLF